MENDVSILLFSTLFPSSARPLHGVFVETRLRELLRRGGVQARIVAPVPWFWSTDEKYGRYADMARTPGRETHNGLEVVHPRSLRLPKVGMVVAPILLALGAYRAIRRLQKEGFDFDLIDAHYYYPDGVAAALLATWLRKPLVVTARGTDVNLIPESTVPRALIRWAARRASASIGVSEALVSKMRSLQLDSKQLLVMRNGVDAVRFKPMATSLARSRINVDGAPIVMCVGNLHEYKGQRLLVQAFAEVVKVHPNARLLLVGDGPDRAVLERTIAELGLAGCARLVGAVPNTELAPWYSAADVLVLASSREGWPNVLLEAMACGTPVVATAVGGIPEVVASPVVGRLVGERTPAAFAAAMLETFAAPPDRSRVRAYAERFSWDETSRQQLALFSALASQR